MKIRVINAYDVHDVENHFQGKFIPRMNAISPVQYSKRIRELYKHYGHPDRKNTAPENYFFELLVNLDICTNSDVIMYPETGMPNRKIVDFVFKVIEWYKDKENKVINLYTESDYIVESFRLAIKDKLISLDDIEFVYVDEYSNGNIVKYTEAGTPANSHPKGWFSHYEKLLMSLM